MKNKSLILLILSVLLLFVSCKENEEITVFSDGKTEYTIVIAEGASAEEGELAKGLSDLSGAYPNTVTDKSPESALEILIGDTNRAVTAELKKKFLENSSSIYFRFLIAESGGKLVVLADADIGYIYALDYINKNYITEGRLTISKDTYDLQQVVWDDYYASDLYLKRLTEEADKNRFENLKDQLENESNRYDENKGNTIMTVEQAIEQYKKLVGSFNTADFGEYTADIFTTGNIYREPTVYPESNQHPRLLLTEDNIGTVKENLTAGENSAAYKRYIALSDAPCDGKFKALSGTMVHNYDAGMVGQIEAKALRYALERDAEKYPDKNDDPASIYGYEAIYAVKNAMLTLKRSVPASQIGDWCRLPGHLMYVMACVYDWCYDLLTDEDKAQLVAGGVNILGMEQECVRYVSATNKVPTGQEMVWGHGGEDQLAVDYFSFAIACFDEAPEIYKLVGGRVLNDFVESQNYLFASGIHWQGSWYNSYRSHPAVMVNYFVTRMKNLTAEDAPVKNVEEAIVNSLHTIRPDGQILRIGDYYHAENLKHFDFDVMGAVTFYAGNYYGNERLKACGYEYRNNFNLFTYQTTGLSPVQFLLTNNPDVSHTFEGEAPLTATTRYPYTSLFAQSANDDPNAYQVYMAMPDFYIASHAHMECGSFQIFYKGALASESGSYAGWGSEHHMGYSMQSIASNTIQVYNPVLKDTADDYRTTMIYTGGQSIENCTRFPQTLADFTAENAVGRLGQVVHLGTVNFEDESGYRYSYMGGDMTGAYDAITVDEVTRYMFSVATDDKDCPLVFLTFDRITSKDESFHKSALIHIQNAPVVLGDYYLLSDTTDGKLVLQESDASDNYAIITNGGGKLVVQSVGYDTEYTVVGGDGYEWWIPYADENENYSLEAGKNLVPSREPSDISEYGWGRIEISPKEAAETNYMLTVMYVTDASNNKTPVKAQNIASESLAGAEILGKAVLFPKEVGLLETAASFTLANSGECFVAGVKEGAWNVTCGTETKTVTVKTGENLLTFTAEKAGTYTIAPAD